jgi:hypothetical protein
LFIIDKYAGAKNLIKEMKIVNWKYVTYNNRGVESNASVVL